MEDLDYILLPI